MLTILIVCQVDTIYYESMIALRILDNFASIQIQINLMNTYEQDDEMFDESPISTIKRELISIGFKIRYATLFLPQHRQQSINYLKQWDLWGPLIICLLFAVPLAVFAAGERYKNEDFINVFIIYWLGAFLISVNCKLLGGKGSLFRTMSAVGYCTFPMAIFGLIVSVIPKGSVLVLKLIIIIISMLWSIASCVVVMKDLVSEQKTLLCVYPVVLFYMFLGWYAIVA